jgi:probable F420-dependent oxidoreductase
VKIDSTLVGALRETATNARELEATGYDALWATETNHEPFLRSLEAARSTEQITVGTAIAVAFARSPMTIANVGYDLAEYSDGRFILGLGSQVKAHIERRFSMPWSHPAARMREFVLALRSIWACWQEGTALDFQGEFYRHSLMTPFFSPDPHVYGAPPVFLAGVGDLMTEVAGEACDGLLLHAFTTERYLSDVTIPAVLRGRRRVGLEDLNGFTISGMPMICPGRDDRELEEAIRATKKQIAFYASTPAYRGVLDIHGWGDLQPRLTELSRQGRWDEMGDAIDDEMLHTIAIVGDPVSVGRGLKERWGDRLDRMTLYVTYDVSRATLDEIAAHAR